MERIYYQGELKGSAVVETACVMPVILLVWIVVIYALFYYHDKSILTGAAYETAVAGSELAHRKETIPEGALEQYFSERVAGKLLFFSEPSAEVSQEKDKIVIETRVSGKRMKLYVRKSAAITRPEKQIRKLRIAKQWIGEVVE